MKINNKIAVVGNPVVGGTSGYVMYVDANGLLAQSAALTFDGANLTVGGKITGAGKIYSGGAYNYHTDAAGGYWASGDNSFTTGWYENAGSFIIRGGTVDRFKVMSAGGIVIVAFTSAGGPIYTDGSGNLAQVTAGTSTQILHGGATPSFSAVSLVNDITGTLAPNHGGTGVANNAASTITISGNFATTLTIAGATALTLPTSGTVAVNSNRLDFFAATTSAQLASIISDETGTGVLVLGTNPTLGGITLSAGTNIVTDTTTGSILFATNLQKGALWGATPIVQPKGVNQQALTDSTTGVASATYTLVNVGVVFNSANINANFATLVRQTNEIRNVLVNIGAMKGAA